MAKYANQRTIIIRRDTDNATKNYFKVSNNSLYDAMGRLDEKGFILWVYLASNKNKYQLDLSSADFCKKSGLSDSSYRRAFTELEQLGYLKPLKENKQLYLFCEMSDVQPDRIKTLSEDEIDLLCMR